MTTATNTPAPTGRLEELIDLMAGAGAAFFPIALIPGLLPTVVLTVVAGAVLLLPLLVVGAVLGVLVLAARAGRWAVTAATGRG